MDKRPSLPWPSIILCITACVALLAGGLSLWLVLAVSLVWLGSIWLIVAQPDAAPQPLQETSFTSERMGELVEYSGSPILVIEHSRVTVANRAARRLLGKHLIGQDLRMALRHPAAIKLMDKKKSGFTQIRGLVRRRDLWRINRQVLNQQMSVIEMLNQTSEADIRHAHTDFVANASHELRTPLASIIGYVETLSESGPSVPPEKRKRFLDTILSEANRLQSLVSDLMSLSRIEAEKHEQPEQKTDFGKLVRRAAKEVAGIDREARLQFDINGSVYINGDERQLEQLVRNLVDNALKYGDSGSDVTVALSLNDALEATLSVTDRGEGIAPEHLPHLTRRFYRTDPGRSRASGGTGLGLAIVKHIVERHRGRLDISSEQGQGTIFTVRIPALEA